MHYETVGWIFKDLLLLDFLHSCILDLCYYGLMLLFSLYKIHRIPPSAILLINGQL